ncbi:MAG: acetylornithine deacetylase [Enterobacteriaceae bacterium]
MKSKLPDFIELYRQLIATPSISALESELDQSNKALIDLLAQWLDSAGFKVDVQAVPESRNKFNLLASMGEGPGGLLLSGHTDTVPFDDNRWSRDPFTLSEHDNKLYGLGTADMKGFFAFIVDALREVQQGTLRRPLHILATADEETTMKGARYFADSHRELRPDCAIIGEPTSLQPVYAHKGHIANSIRITGQSGHSSDPAKGINAIEIMHEVIAQLLILRHTLQERYHHPAFAIPYPTMNLGHIHGGDAVNRICACCELHMDIRPTPGLSLKEMEELLYQSLEPVMQRWPQRLSITALHDFTPAYECPVQQPAVSLVEHLAGHSAQSVNYCTEAPYLQQLCPTIVMGPGSIEQAHQPDEYLSLDFVQPTRRLMQQLIKNFCYCPSYK